MKNRIWLVKKYFSPTTLAMLMTLAAPESYCELALIVWDSSYIIEFMYLVGWLQLSIPFLQFPALSSPLLHLLFKSGLLHPIETSCFSQCIVLYKIIWKYCNCTSRHVFDYIYIIIQCIGVSLQHWGDYTGVTGIDLQGNHTEGFLLHALDKLFK